MTMLITMDELLARYITSSKWFRKKDKTVKQDAFIPPKVKDRLELSVTRHINLTENDIWKIGRGVAGGMSRNLHGRADVESRHIIAQKLELSQDPVKDNPNHTNIINWPIEKNARKMCALEIAKSARFVENL